MIKFILIVPLLSGGNFQWEVFSSEVEAKCYKTRLFEWNRKKDFAMKRYLILAVLLAATSCSTTRYVSSEPSLKAEWVGRSHADIVRNFGAPTREVSDGADGVILVYESFYTTHETDHLRSPDQ